MEKMIDTLQSVGYSDDEIKRIFDIYSDDPDGLDLFVLIVRAMFDDREQYI